MPYYAEIATPQQLQQSIMDREAYLAPIQQRWDQMVNPYNNQRMTQVPMVKAKPGTVLDRVFNLPSYQLAFGTNANQINPLARFQADPGYQFQQTEGLRQLAQQASAQGLLGSSSMLRRLLELSQGNADQSYQRWMSNQMGVYNDYQNRLQGLMQMGPSVSGAQQAFDTGQNMSNASLQTGYNTGGLQANQGVFGGSGYLNTGAAKSSNLMQGLAIQAQIDAANAAGSGGGGGGAGGIGSIVSGLGSMMGGFF